MDQRTPYQSIVVVAGLVAATLISSGCHKSQIMMGIATDFPAPTPLSSVHLDVSREGVPVIQNDWQIVGGVAPMGQYNLPGSFNVYADDGSEPRVQVTITARKPDGTNSTLVERDALFNLVRDRTLFMRLTLVKQCQAKTNGGMLDDCGAGLTCVEGVCKTAEIEAKRLPDYSTDPKNDLVTHLACDSGGSVLLDGKTGQPMPVLGDCGADEFCVEGTCMKKFVAGLDNPDGGALDGSAALSCNPFGQTDATCGTASRCDVDHANYSIAASTGVCTPRATPAGVESAPCTDPTSAPSTMDTCGLGLDCGSFEFGRGGVCRKICSADTDCNAAAAIGISRCDTATFGGGPFLCTIACDPMAANGMCPSGQACRLLGRATVGEFDTDCRPLPPTPIPENMTCTKTDDCVSGNVCLAGVCHPLCHRGSATDCMADAFFPSCVDLSAVATGAGSDMSISYTSPTWGVCN